MIVKTRKSAGLLLGGLMVAFLLMAIVKQPAARPDSGAAGHTTRSTGIVGNEHTNCHVKAVQKSGQDPGEEEGNPTHKSPEHSCSHKPTDKQVRCHCHVECNPNDGTEREDTRCRSYCYKDMCTCPRKPCA